jgi:hypothetical protein
MPITDQMIIPPSGNISILKADGRHVLAIERPQFSFAYHAIKYIQAVQEILIDGQALAMTDAQRDEVAAFLAGVEPDETLSLKVAENQRNRRFLNETDWYVVRHAETGVGIPADILALRAGARAAIHDL